MAINNINAQIGLNFNKSSVGAVVSNVTTVKKQVLSVGPVFAQFQKKIETLGNVAKWTAIGTGAERAFGGIKSIVDSVTNSFKKQFDFAESYASAGDKIAKTSRLVGLSVKDYQAFTSAAKHAGMSTEEIDSALKKFNVSLGKARSGDKSAFKMFDSILGGKKLSDFKDSSSLIAAIADGYKKLGSAEQKAFVSNELFGRGGAKMTELLSGGGDELKKALADFEGGFDDEGAKNAEIFNDELQKTQEIIDSLKISAAQELFPIITDMFKSVQKFVKDNKAELLPVVKDIFGRTVVLVKSLLPMIPPILKFVLAVLNFFGPKISLFVGGFLSMLPVLAQIGMGLMAMSPLIVKAFTLVKGIMAVIAGPTVIAIGGILVLIGEIVYIVKQFYDNWDMLCSFVKHELKDAFIEWFEELKSIFAWVYEGAVNLVASIKDKFVGLVVGIGDVFKVVAEKIGDFCTGVISTIFEFVQKIKGAFSNIFGGLPSKLQSLFGLGDVNVNVNGSSSAQSTLAASAAQAISESHTTVTNRFAVDFTNVPRGAKITPPPKGDFDWSRGYMLGGV